MLTTFLEYYNNIWYLEQCMIKVGINNIRVNPTIDLDQVYNDYDPKSFEPKALSSKKAIRMKVLCE